MQFHKYWENTVTLDQSIYLIFFYAIPIRKRERDKIMFHSQWSKYQFSFLTKGLTHSPRAFTKVHKPLFARLRSRGHVNSTYSDNSCLQVFTVTIYPFKILGKLFCLWTPWDWQYNGTNPYLTQHNKLFSWDSCSVPWLRLPECHQKGCKRLLPFVLMSCLNGEFTTRKFYQ